MRYWARHFRLAGCAVALCAAGAAASCLPQADAPSGSQAGSPLGAGAPSWGEVAAFPSACGDPAFRLPRPMAAPGGPIYAGPSPLEPDIIAQTNALRRQAGLPALRCEAGLSRIAMRHSVAMAERNELFHVDQAGHHPFDRMRTVYPSFYGRVAENLGYQTIRVADFSAPDLWSAEQFDHGALAQRYIRLWRDSPGHRANLLRDGVTHIGIGIALRGNRLYVTQVFAGAQNTSSF